MLNIHSAASYLSPKGAKSRAAEHYFLGTILIEGKPIFLNGVIYTLSTILKMVAASAAGAELGGLFMNIKEGRFIQLTLAKMTRNRPLPSTSTTPPPWVLRTIKLKKQRSR